MELPNPRSKIALLDGKQCIGTRSLSTIEALYTRGLVTVHSNTKGLSCMPVACRWPRTPVSLENRECEMHNADWKLHDPDNR